MRATSLCVLLSLSPAFAGDMAFVTSQTADMVSVVDLQSGQIAASVALPGGPAPVAFDGNHAFVIAAKTGDLSVIDGAGKIIRTTALGEGAFGIAAQGGAIYVTDWYAARVSRLGPDLRPVWAAPTGHAPAGVAISPDGTRIATADRDDDRITVFDAATGAELRRIATGKHPFGITWYGGRIYTADVQSDTLTVADPDTGTTQQIATGSHPYGVAFAQGRGFVTNQYAGTLTVFDEATLAPIAEIEVGEYPEGIAALPDGSGVAVASWDADLLTLIDAQSLEVMREIKVPSGPRAFGVFTGRSFLERNR